MWVENIEVGSLFRLASWTTLELDLENPLSCSGPATVLGGRVR